MNKDVCTTEVCGKWGAVQGTRALHLKQLCLCPAAAPLVSITGHSGSLFKDDTRQLERSYIDRPIHKIDKGHTGHDSSNNELCDRSSPQLGPPEQYTDILHSFQRTVICLKRLLSCDYTVGYQTLDDNHLDFQANSEVQSINRTIAARLQLYIEEHQEDWEQQCNHLRSFTTHSKGNYRHDVI